MRQLSLVELSQLSGAGTVYYPPFEPGFELIGWEEEIVAWDITSTYNYYTGIEYVTKIPVYNITPIYAPVMTTIIYS